MKNIALLAAIVVAGPVASWASNYHCSLKEGRGGNMRETWAGDIALRDGPTTTGKVLIIKKDGSAIPLDQIQPLNNADTSVQQALKPYDGLLVLGCWTSRDAKEVGLLDSREGIWALCKLEK